MNEFWSTFYADDSLFYSQLSHPSSETYGNYGYWQKPTEDKFRSFVGRGVEMQRDIDVEFELPANPIYSHGTATKHFMILDG